MNLMRRMENIEPYVPPGFRFHPTDEELVGYYLKKKVASEKIDLNVIKDVDLYRIEPWDIQELCKIGYEEEREWYFFSHKDKKYPTGTRMNRATMAGFWKATGRDKAVYQHSKLIGMRKTLVFYIGRAPNGHKTDWIMHEYRLDTDFNSLPQEEGWVVCRAFKKRNSCQARSIGSWNPCYIDEGCNDPSILGSSGNLLTQPQTLINKKDIALDLNDILPSEYIQLPQLESPHHSLSKKPRWVHKETEKKEETEIENRNKNTAKVADWRVLDRFVASQLSPGEEEEEKWGEEWLSDAVSLNHSSDFAFFLLQNELGGGGKMNRFHKQETQS